MQGLYYLSEESLPYLPREIAVRKPVGLGLSAEPDAKFVPPLSHGIGDIPDSRELCDPRGQLRRSALQVDAAGRRQLEIDRSLVAIEFRSGKAQRIDSHDEAHALAPSICDLDAVHAAFAATSEIQPDAATVPSLAAKLGPDVSVRWTAH